MGVRGLRWFCHCALEFVGCDELSLALVPCLEDLGGRRTSQDTWMDKAGELDMRDMS
jgi:hypothetical protein